MPGSSNGFTVHETHGPLLRPGLETHASSNRRGWTSLFASEQQEIPFEDRFASVDDQLIVLHLSGPVTVHRRIRNGEGSRVIPPGGLFMVPGGMDFGVRLAGPLRTLHLYLESLGFAQNFLSSCELEALHFIGIGSFGEEFREDVVFRGIQEQFRKPLA